MALEYGSVSQSRYDKTPMVCLGLSRSMRLRLKNVERVRINIIYTPEQEDKEAEKDAAKKEIWIRLANLYLKFDMRIEIGIWIGTHSLLSTSLDTLETVARRIVDPRWSQPEIDAYRPKFISVMECEEMEDGETAIELLEDAGFAVVESLDSVETTLARGVDTFEEVFDLMATAYDAD
jgi:hypothetical protein